MSEARLVKLARSKLAGVAGDLFEAISGLTVPLSVEQLRGLTTLLERASTALQSSDACSSFLESVSSTLAAELASLKSRAKSADVELVDLRAKAQRLEELERSKVRLHIAAVRRAARRSLADSGAQAAAGRQLANPPPANAPSSTPASDEVADLRRRLELYRDERERDALTLKTVTQERDSLRDRLDAAEKVAAAAMAEQADLEQKYKAYRRLGSLGSLRDMNREIANYRGFGTVGAIRRRMTADAVTIAFLQAILAQARAALLKYEKLIGPVLLTGFREAGAVSTALGVLNKLRGEANPSAPHVNLGFLAPVFDHLVSRLTPDGFQINGSDALATMAVEIAKTDPSVPTGTFMIRQKIVNDCTRLMEKIENLRPDDDIEQFLRDLGGGELESLFKQGSLFGGGFGGTIAGQLNSTGDSSASAAPSSQARGGNSDRSPSPDAAVSGRAPPAGAKMPAKKKAKTNREGAVTAAQPQSQPSPDLTPQDVVDLTDSRGSPVPKNQGRKSSATPAGLSAERGANYVSQSTLNSMRESYPIWAAGWPESGPPSTLSADQIERLAWRLGLFPCEAVAPNYNQDTKFLTEANARLNVDAAEITLWNAAARWKKFLKMIPKPITSNYADDRFVGLYTETMAFYRLVIRTFYERTHYLVVPSSVDRQWREERKQRHSTTKTQVKAHCRRLSKFLDDNPDIDADLLLDPFFLIAPPIGTVYLLPMPNETILAAADRVDQAEPERAFFLLKPEAHPSHSVRSRIYHKFWRDSPSKSAPSSPSASSRASGKRKRLEVSSDEKEKEGVEGSDDDSTAGEQPRHTKSTPSSPASGGKSKTPGGAAAKSQAVDTAKPSGRTGADTPTAAGGRTPSPSSGLAAQGPTTPGPAKPSAAPSSLLPPATAGVPHAGSTAEASSTSPGKAAPAQI